MSKFCQWSSGQKKPIRRLTQDKALGSLILNTRTSQSTPPCPEPLTVERCPKFCFRVVVWPSHACVTCESGGVEWRKNQDMYRLMQGHFPNDTRGAFSIRTRRLLNAAKSGSANRPKNLFRATPVEQRLYNRLKQCSLFANMPALSFPWEDPSTS